MAFAKKKKSNKKKETSINLLRKKYKSSLASEMYIPSDQGLWIPSRCLTLNHFMGGGAPYGKVLEIFGMESSGKSLLALDFGYSAQQLGGVLLLADAEQAYSEDWAVKNGLDPTKIEIIGETSIEKISDWIADMSLYYRSKLTNNEPIVVMLDSLAAIDCEVNINSDQVDSKAEMGNRAKAIYKMLRTRGEMFNKLGITIIFINQLRQKINTGMFEDPDTTVGGNAMKFFASIRLGFYAGKQIKHGEKRVGVEVSARMKKNKVSPPRAPIKLNIYFEEKYRGYVGLDRYLGLDEILMESGIITKQGNSYIFKGKQIATSKLKLAEAMQSKLLRIKMIKAADINSISTLRNRLDEIGTNLFPTESFFAKKGKEEENNGE